MLPFLAVDSDTKLHCWASWTEDEWMFMLLARLNSPPQFVLVSNAVYGQRKPRGCNFLGELSNWLQ